MERAVRTKNDVRIGVEALITDAEVYFVNRPVAVRVVQWRCRELACVFGVIDAAELDTTLVARA